MSEEEWSLDEYWHCPFCPCLFIGKCDLDAHMNSYGREPYKHRVKWHDSIKNRNYEREREYPKTPYQIEQIIKRLKK